MFLFLLLVHGASHTTVSIVCSFQYIPRGFSSVPEDLGAMMDLGAFQPAIAMIFHVESELAVQNAGFLRPDPEKYRIVQEHFRIFSGKNPESFRKNSFQYIPSEQPVRLRHVIRNLTIGN